VGGIFLLLLRNFRSVQALLKEKPAEREKEGGGKYLLFSLRGKKGSTFPLKRKDPSIIPISTNAASQRGKKKGEREARCGTKDVLDPLAPPPRGVRLRKEEGRASGTKKRQSIKR